MKKNKDTALQSEKNTDIESVANIKVKTYKPCMIPMDVEDLKTKSYNYNGPINIYEIALENPQFDYAVLDTKNINKAEIPKNLFFDIEIFRQKPQNLFKNVLIFSIISHIVMFMFFQLPAFSYLFTYPFIMFVKKYTQDDINFFTIKESNTFLEGMSKYLDRTTYFILLDVFISMAAIFSATETPILVRFIGYVFFIIVFLWIAKKKYAERNSATIAHDRKVKYYYDSRNELWVPEDLIMKNFQNAYSKFLKKSFSLRKRYNNDELKDFKKKIDKKESFAEWEERYNQYLTDKKKEEENKFKTQKQI